MKNILYCLLLFTLMVIPSNAISQSFDGEYFYKNSKWYLKIELNGDEFIFSEIEDDNAIVAYKAKFHVNDKNIIILDKVLEGKDGMEFLSAWNSFQVPVNEDGIEFYEDFDREDDRMFFTRIK